MADSDQPIRGRALSGGTAHCNCGEEVGHEYSLISNPSSIFARMTRKPRVEFEGAFTMSFVRGNQRQRIFRNDRDRLRYPEPVEHYRQRRARQSEILG
jgi:hypothetical protein